MTGRVEPCCKELTICREQIHGFIFIGIIASRVDIPFSPPIIYRPVIPVGPSDGMLSPLIPPAWYHLVKLKDSRRSRSLGSSIVYDL